MTHEPEICYWAKHPDETKVWVKTEPHDWNLYDEPHWKPYSKYIVDNKWAELRKAQADGKQLQYYYDDVCWVDMNFTIENSDEDIVNWRIKPKKTIYEWQWIYKVQNGFMMTTAYYATRDEVERDYLNEIIEKYEPSKRERKC